jgi:hypothetical protein
VTGDSGAPLKQEEAKILEEIFPVLRNYLSAASVDTIETSGASVIDIENDTVTPLNNGRECAYTIFENGVARCAIEKAFNEGAVTFRKPISCYLYPIRIKKYSSFEAVNYDRWDICHPAVQRGNELHMPVYRFVKEALTLHYGHEWFDLLEAAAKNLKIERNP